MTGLHRLVALPLLCAAQFMVILGVTVVSVAMPSIQAADLGFAFADLQWVVTGCTTRSTGNSMPLTAGFADAFHAAAGIALVASLTALVALFRADVPAGTRPAFAAH